MQCVANDDLTTFDIRCSRKDLRYGMEAFKFNTTQNIGEYQGCDLWLHVPDIVIMSGNKAVIKYSVFAMSNDGATVALTSEHIDVGVDKLIRRKIEKAIATARFNSRLKMIS